MNESARALCLRRAIPPLVFAAVFLTHNTGVITSFDSRWTIPTARSIVREGNTDLDEYPARLEANRYYAIERIGGRQYSIFPIGAALVAVPGVFVLDGLGLALSDDKLERLLASIVIALTAMLLYLIGRESLGVRGALFLALIFAFGTAAWSTGSRALWQHGPSMLMLTLALWLLLAGRRHPRLISLAGLPLALSFVIRPTNAISIAALSAFVLAKHPRRAVLFALWMLAVAIPFALFVRSVYGSWLPAYYAPGRFGHFAAFGEAMLGHGLSPSRGLFVFSPILALSVYGAYLSLRRGADLLDCVLVAIVALHWLVISSFPIWWGGHSFGYRLFSDMLPYLMYFLIPVIARAGALPRWRRRALSALMAVLVAVSVLIHYRGAHSRRVHHWNASPVNVDDQPGRVWDWRDPQFLR